MNAIDNWSNDVWKSINDKLKGVMGKIRICQKVFPTTVTGNDNPVPADLIDLTTGVPSTGLTKPVVTVSKTFQLADIHVKDLPKLDMGMNQVMLAAQALALTEDTLLFQGSGAIVGAGLDVSNAADLGKGLLGKAVEINNPIVVPSPDPNHKGVYGSATFGAVASGIVALGANLQGPPYALILDPATFADANSPLEDDSVITPATAIKALVDDGGFYMSPGLPKGTGLLASLGGATTKLFVGTEPVVEFSQRDPKGIYFFIARESIQFHNIDARALIRIDFK